MFVTAKLLVLSDNTGAYIELPGLLTPSGVLMPLLDYCLARSHDRSLVWMDKVIRSVQMFLEYLQCHRQQHEPQQLFRNFAQRLYSGTFDPATGLDPSGLGWSPRSGQDARAIISNLTAFFEWLGHERPAAAQVNPRYAGDTFDQRCDAAAYQFRRERAMLGHLWGAAGATPMGHKVRAQRAVRVRATEPPAFPEDRFMDLITKGFKVGDRLDYRGILITLLLHGAGFRESEPFHLYIEDVMPEPANPERAKVRIHHPSEGFAPASWRDALGQSRKGHRVAYLADKFGLVPRTQLLDTRGAGWKGGLHDGPYYKEAYWFQPEYGELFLQVWQRYLHEVARVDRSHPFAFINLSREPVGEMYCLGQYIKAHAAACRRIGLEVGKALGTTPHGHRHAYGQRLRRAGVDKLFVQRFMHHASMESQETYTQPNSKEVETELQAAAQRMQTLTDTSVILSKLSLKGDAV